MKIQLEKNFQRKLAKQIDRWRFQVGVLDDKPHFEPVQAKNAFETPALKSFAGGDARKIDRSQKSELTTGQIFIANQQRLGVNLLLEPFEKQSSDIIKFTNSFLKMAIGTGQTAKRRVENLLQAIVRNPILRGDYGPNRNVTANIKGFNRNMIDTAQMFKAIKAKVTRV